MKTLSTVLVVVGLLFGWAFYASAQLILEPIDDLVLDVNGPTPEFRTLMFTDQTVNTADVDSLSNVTVGTTYVDIGHGIVTSLIDKENRVVGNDVITTDAGFRDEWAVWLEWMISAHISDIRNNVYSVDYDYGVVNAYICSMDYDLGLSPSPLDDTNPSTLITLLSANLVPELSSGVITYDDITGNVSKTATVVFRANILGKSIHSTSVDLLDLFVHNDLFAIATQSQASGLSNFGTDTNGNLIIESTGTGSICLARPVPEPASIMLFGIALSSTAAIIRRRK